MPHTLRSLQLTDEITVLVGFHQDLAAEATRTINRIRGPLIQFPPSLERVLGPRLNALRSPVFASDTDPRPLFGKPAAANSSR